jgi:hypothetical protein
VKWSFAQIGLLVISAFHVIQAVIGFIAEPSFATGPGAPTVQILGMDYNGWRAVALTRCQRRRPVQRRTPSATWLANCKPPQGNSSLRSNCQGRVVRQRPSYAGRPR